jgi:hypothetical protein
LNFEDVADTVRRRVNLADVRGAKFIPSFDDVTLLVDIYAEKSVEVPIRGINFPPDKVLRTFPSKVQVTFQVGLSHFKSIHLLGIQTDVVHISGDGFEIDRTLLPLIVQQRLISHPDKEILGSDGLFDRTTN